MLPYCLLALCSAGDASAPADKLPSNVEVTVDATKTDARGLQLISIRLKVQPKHALRFSKPQAALKLTITTSDPRTQISVIYPQGHQQGPDVYYKDEVAIQVLVQRAANDRSPVRGRLDFARVPMCVTTDIWSQESMAYKSVSYLY